jgi:hypothetical protein
MLAPHWGFHGMGTVQAGVNAHHMHKWGLPIHTSARSHQTHTPFCWVMPPAAGDQSRVHDVLHSEAQAAQHHMRGPYHILDSLHNFDKGDSPHPMLLRAGNAWCTAGMHTQLPPAAMNSRHHQPVNSNPGTPGAAPFSGRQSRPAHPALRACPTEPLSAVGCSQPHNLGCNTPGDRATWQVPCRGH